MSEQVDALCDEIREIADEAASRFGEASNDTAYDEAHAGFFGRKSRISEIKRAMRELPNDAKPVLGRALNEANGLVQDAADSAQRRLAATREQAMLESERADLTVPGRRPPVGHTHLLTRVIDDFCDVFVGMGYKVADGPHVEKGWYNFDALNVPKTHPARAETDTIFVDGPLDDDGEYVRLLRTQTSPMQVRIMETTEPPLYYVVPGRVFRQDTVDATHSNQFHQVEGLAIDRDITFGDMAGTIERFCHEFFGPSFDIRLFPDYFPFTEPSAGIEVRWGDSWLEIAGLGMVDPNVLEAVGYDTETWQGFAFGFGVERIAMLLYGVDDIRSFLNNDVRFLEQFA